MLPDACVRAEGRDGLQGWGFRKKGEVLTVTLWCWPGQYSAALAHAHTCTQAAARGEKA